MTYRQYRLSGFLILLCTVAIFSAGVRDKNTVTAAFKSARLLYTYGKYDSAANYIRGFLKRYGKDPSTEYMVPLLMESLVRTHESDYFKKLTQIYYKKFPESAFVPRVYYLDGIVSAWQRDYKTSVQLFAEAMNRGLSPTLDSLALLNVRYVCERLASYDDLGSLRERSKLSSVIMEIVSFNEIKKLSENAQTGRAKQLAEDFRAKFPRSEYRQFIKRLTSDPRSRKTIVVGLLAPLSGENADLGRLVMQSVQLSVENFNDMHDQQIDLVVADTKGSMVDAAKKMQELLTVQKINFFIGPILSSTAAVAAAVQMNYKSDVVMITPTATDEGIAQLGKYIFQLNVTPTMLAARIARYAVENLHIKEYAILAPLSDYGRIFSASFKNEVTKLGGLILDEEYFEEGTNDFKLQFENMRKKLTDLRWEKLAAEGASDKYSSPRYKDNFLADSTIEVGGLFIPATAEDASKIASQVYFHRIRTQLLGSNGWHAASILTDGKRYVENALISTGAEPDEKSELWVQFSKEYKIRFKEPADRVVAPLGFDAANLLFQAIANDDDAQAVGNYLHRVKGYRGVTGTITFENGGGVNTETAILKIGNKNFIQVQ